VFGQGLGSIAARLSFIAPLDSRPHDFTDYECFFSSPSLFSFFSSHRFLLFFFLLRAPEQKVKFFYLCGLFFFIFPFCFETETWPLPKLRLPQTPPARLNKPFSAFPESHLPTLLRGQVPSSFGSFPVQRFSTTFLFQGFPWSFHTDRVSPLPVPKRSLFPPPLYSPFAYSDSPLFFQLYSFVECS